MASDVAAVIGAAMAFFLISIARGWRRSPRRTNDRIIPAGKAEWRDRTSRLLRSCSQARPHIGFLLRAG